jgi:phosphate-selective porin
MRPSYQSGQQNALAGTRAFPDRSRQDLKSWLEAATRGGSQLETGIHPRVAAGSEPHVWERLFKGAWFEETQYEAHSDGNNLVPALPFSRDDGASDLHLSASLSRYGRVETTDEGIDGGVMDGWWAGVNWWATNRFKASVTYGNIDLDRLELVGNTQTFLARMQWI